MVQSGWNNLSVGLGWGGRPRALYIDPIPPHKYCARRNRVIGPGSTAYLRAGVCRTTPLVYPLPFADLPGKCWAVCLYVRGTLCYQRVTTPSTTAVDSRDIMSCCAVALALPIDWSKEPLSATAAEQRNTRFWARNLLAAGPTRYCGLFYSP